MSNQKSFFSILSTPSVEFSFKTILATYDMWKEYMDKGLSKEEIAIAKESLVNSYPLSFDSPVKRLSLRVASFMYNIHIDTDKEYAQKISHLTNNDIIDALKKKQSLNRWVIAVTIDKNIFEEQKNQYKKEKGTVPSWMNPVKIYTPEEVIE